MAIVQTFLILTISAAKGQRWFAATDLVIPSNVVNSTFTNETNHGEETVSTPGVSENRRNYSAIEETSEEYAKNRRSDSIGPNIRKLNLKPAVYSGGHRMDHSSSVHAKFFYGKRRHKCPALGPETESGRSRQFGDKRRFLGVFHVVNIPNVGCSSSSGLGGTCLHQYECETSGGIAMGSCADGYGACCVKQYSCGDSTAATEAWFTSPGYPSPSTERLSCSLTLDKASEEVMQIRLDLTSFELLPPTDGSCEQDQFVVSGHNVNSMVPILCGINNGQHLYIEVGNVPGPVYLSVQSVTADSRLFAIKVTQLRASDELTAPVGCLQHHVGAQGVLESFNYQDKSALILSKNPSYLNNMNYAMCIQRNAESCSITYSNLDVLQIPNYDEDGLPVIPAGQAGVEVFNCPSDWLLAAAARLCGERLNDGSVLQDFSVDAPVTDSSAGPLVVWFRSDSGTVGRGFRLQYTQNACTAS